MVCLANQERRSLIYHTWACIDRSKESTSHPIRRVYSLTSQVTVRTDLSEECVDYQLEEGFSLSDVGIHKLSEDSVIDITESVNIANHERVHFARRLSWPIR
jgi:hypothetical protein